MKLATKAIHGRNPEAHKKPGHPAVMPIYQSSTFHLGEHEYENIIAGNTRGINLYTRLGNPNCRSVADKFAFMHSTEKGELYSSGLGAITSTLLSFLTTGESLITSLDIYGGTVELINRIISRYGIEIINVDPANLAQIESAIKPNTKVMFFETITNPVLKVLDIDAIAEITKERGILLVIDNTFASAVNFRPIEHGADIVLESSTKYIGGHSDTVGGVVASSDKLMREMWKTTVSIGATADPFAAFLTERGMKTLPLRIEKHNKNALAVAKFLDSHPAVEKVIYPGLPSHPHHELAVRILDGFGGMISFIVKDGDEGGQRFLAKLRYPVEATSLGGVESLIEMPFNTSHAPLTEAERIKVGIVPGFVRISVGIEDVEDLIGDLKQALDSII